MPKNQRKKTALEVLSENLAALMAADTNLSTGPKVAALAGTSRKTINNLVKKRHDPHLSLIESIAKAFRLEVYQLLLPELDENLLAIFRVYRETGEAGQNLLSAAAETARGIHERKTAGRAGASSNE